MANIPTKYDDLIRTHVAKHLPGIDWRLIKAQFYQESLLDPKAVSPVGAQGIAQFMPMTWHEEVEHLGWPKDADPFDAALSIEAGCHYMRRMRAGWAGCADPMDQHKIACASYNCGIGNMRRASREAASYKADAVLAALPKITGKHAKETQIYVRKIYTWYAQLIAEAL